jgi:hypothetical protein
VFSPFGAALKEKGFIQISQLSQEYLSLKDLQELLDIDMGTAILILQYAKADVEAIEGGKLLILSQI